MFLRRPPPADRPLCHAKSVQPVVVGKPDYTELKAVLPFPPTLLALLVYLLLVAFSLANGVLRRTLSHPPLVVT